MTAAARHRRDLARRRRLAAPGRRSTGCRLPTAAVAQLRLALLRGQRPAGRLRRRRPDDLREPLRAAGARHRALLRLPARPAAQRRRTPARSAAGSSVSGVSFAFYPGGAYPAEYDGALFFADYSRKCIWVMTRGADGLPDRAAGRGRSSTAAAGPVDLEMSPGRRAVLRRPQRRDDPPRSSTGSGPTSCPAGQYLAEYFAEPDADRRRRRSRRARRRRWTTGCGHGAPRRRRPGQLLRPLDRHVRLPGGGHLHLHRRSTDDGIRVWVDGALADRRVARPGADDVHRHPGR